MTLYKKYFIKIKKFIFVKQINNFCWFDIKKEIEKNLKN